MILIVMGVAGCGKSTIGQLLADRVGWPFYDGDDFHPSANIEKMSKGIPLTDEDRSGWLSALAELIGERIQHNQSAVIACSALKQKYRDRLAVDARVRFVYLCGSYDLIEARLCERPGHYMKPELLASQFAALEEPTGVLTLDVSLAPEQLVTEIVRQLGRRSANGPGHSGAGSGRKIQTRSEYVLRGDPEVSSGEDCRDDAA